MNNLLEAKNLSKSFKEGNEEIKAVNNIDFSIKENEKLFTNPGGNFILQPGQVLIAFGSKEQLNILNGLLGNLVVAVELLK